MMSDYQAIKQSGEFDEAFYLGKYDDVRRADVDALRHFVKIGWREFRQPNPWFITKFYLEKYQDVKSLGVNPFVHYLKHGKTEGRLPNGNLTQFKKVAVPASKQEEKSVAPWHEPKFGPIRRSWNYFKKHGITKFLSRLRSEIKSPTPIHQRGVSPIVGKDDTRFISAYEAMLANAKSENSENYVENSALPPVIDPLVKLIAFYLPQFHPIPENDQWWGRGFTEWNNVSKAVPQFTGHYQPRLPGELGFYDLRIPEIQERQAELAEQYGIFGFAFHYYWFNGKRLLEKPLTQFADNPNIKLPFCVCWANENWTRRWDGFDQDILIGQVHSFENDKEFIASLEALITNPRYIRINGRPLVIIYRAMLLENPSKTTAYWRDYAIKKGWGDPYLVAVQAFGFEDPREVGFDAALEFPPLNVNYSSITQNVELLNTNYEGIVFDYNELIKKNIRGVNRPYTLFRGVTPMWDNESRKPGKGNSFTNLDPGLYRRWLEEAAYATLSKTDSERLIFINAWNEWAEGAYLEPDRKYGYAFLKATRDALESVGNRKFIVRDDKELHQPDKKSEYAVILHAYYLDLLEDLRSRLDKLPEPFDLYITTPKLENSEIKTILTHFPNARILQVPNRGRDIGPFLEICRTIINLDYGFVLKLHTKKSVHRNDGSEWRNDMLEKLVNHETFKSIKSAINSKDKIGMVGPQGHVLDRNFYWGSNKDLTLKIAKGMGYFQSENSEFNFIAGSMFWMNGKLVETFSRIPMGLNDFEPEPIPPDGTLAHVMERLIALIAQEEGFEILEVNAEGRLSKPESSRSFRFADPTPSDKP